MALTRILSGVRPTGNIHIGNYFGAIKQWLSYIPKATESLFCIVDQHALTTAQDCENLEEHCYVVAAAYLASGIDPHKTPIFLQSHNPYHTELAWYLNCHTPMGWLNRMTQFKDKAGKKQEQANLGLYAYPVLMAADILLYDTTLVPVGDDQKQHVELARDIAQSINHHFQKDVFIIPEPVIVKEGARIMSLRDGSSKMSKSDLSDFTRIHLQDTPDLIIQKIKKAKTDPHPLPTSIEELNQRPEAKNLLTIYALSQNIKLDEAFKKWEGESFSGFKTSLAESLIECLTPIRSRMEDFLKDKASLHTILKEGAKKARDISHHRMETVRKTMGLIQE